MKNTLIGLPAIGNKTKVQSQPLVNRLGVQESEEKTIMEIYVNINITRIATYTLKHYTYKPRYNVNSNYSNTVDQILRLSTVIYDTLRDDDILLTRFYSQNIWDDEPLYDTEIQLYSLNDFGRAIDSIVTCLSMFFDFSNRVDGLLHILNSLCAITAHERNQDEILEWDELQS